MCQALGGLLEVPTALFLKLFWTLFCLLNWKAELPCHLYIQKRKEKKSNPETKQAETLKPIKTFWRISSPR
jgi:hypothetical protein